MKDVNTYLCNVHQVLANEIHEWCDAVEDDISNFKDVDWIWSQLESDSDLSWRIQVPIIPNLSFWINVLLERKQEDTMLEGSIWAVTVLEPRRIDQPIAALPGNLMPGEGLFVMRSMFIDWFKGNNNWKDIRCVSRRHSLAAQKQWHKNRMNSGKHLVQCMYAWYYGYCSECVPQKFVSSEDLIPENTIVSPFK